MIIQKRKTIIAVGFISLLFGFGTFTYSRINSEHDLLVCQATASHLLGAIELFQKDNMGQLPSSLDELKGYCNGGVSYYDSQQNRAINFDYYNEKGNPLVLSSEAIRQGWAGRPMRVLAVNGLGIVTISEAEFISLSARMKNAKG